MNRLKFAGCRRHAAAWLVAAAALLAATAARAEPPAGTVAPRTAESAVVVMYHRFGESEYPATNIRLDQFDAHLAELTSGKYHVMSLPDIVKTLEAGGKLPDRTVGISIDDAYLSVYENAWPRLKKAGLPATLFVSTDSIDQGLKGFMTWDQLREMKAGGVTIGAHSASHRHMATVDETVARAEIDKANARFVAELGGKPALFAYPYGEASLALEAVVRAEGFTAAFGQHSGVIHPSLGFFYLPRFAMNETFGDIGRFRLAINALPLPVTDLTPRDPLIRGKNPPVMGFTLLDGKLTGLARLACFSSHEGRARVERLGDIRVEVRVNKAFPSGRTRINCTAPAGDGRWRWFGRQFYVKP